MNMKKLPATLLFSCAICALLTVPSAQLSQATELLAQSPQPASPFGQSTTAPQQAPSFLRQAGQKLLDSAQKRMLNQVDKNLQNQQNSQTQTQVQTQTQIQTQSESQNPLNAPYYQAPNVNLPYGAIIPNGGPSPTSGGTIPTTGGTTPPPERKTAAPCRSWVQPGETPIACILCIHGLGLQSNSYEYFGKEQSNRGLAVYAIDVRGFGSWMNAKGKTKVNFDDCLDDIKTALESIHAANPGLPVYLLGESMGGAIALRAASMYPNLVDGLISSVPASERFNQGKTSMKVFLNLLTGFNVANVGNDLVNQATQNQKLKAQWQDDPLARLNLSPQELIQFQDFMNFNHDAAKKVANMPVLFVQGTGDQLVKPEGTWELFNDVAAKDKSFFAVPGEHLIFEEAQTQDPGPRDQNFRVISSWLTAKVGRRHRAPMNGIGGQGGINSGTVGGGGYANGGVGGYSGGGSPGGGGYGSRAPINTAGLEGPAQMIDNKQFDSAIAALEQIRVQKPNDANVLALLGKAYLQSGSPEKAGPLFRQAMRIRRAGGDQAQAFNSYLLNQGTTAQSTTSYASPFERLNSLFGISNAGNVAPVVAPTGKAKVYAFYANWADQCKTMNDAMTQLSGAFGDRVEINRVNIEDASNDALADQFKIGPIPTVVFVTPAGKVGQTIIGESTYNNYAQALSKVTQLR